MKSHESPFINRRKKVIEFRITNQCAHQICVAGTFNHWAKDEYYLTPQTDGTWFVKIPILPRGEYQYKFYIDNQMEMEDIENPFRLPDGVNGFNSVLQV